MFYAGLSTGHQTYQTKPSELACKYYHWQFHKHFYTLVRYLYIHTVSAKYPFNVCNILFIWMKMGSKWNFFFIDTLESKKKILPTTKSNCPKMPCNKWLSALLVLQLNCDWGLFYFHRINTATPNLFYHPVYEPWIEISFLIKNNKY